MSLVFRLLPSTSQRYLCRPGSNLRRLHSQQLSCASLLMPPHPPRGRQLLDEKPAGRAVSPKALDAMTLMGALAVGVDPPDRIVEFPVERFSLGAEGHMAVAKECCVSDLPFHSTAVSGGDMRRAVDVTRGAVPEFLADPTILSDRLCHPLPWPADGGGLCGGCWQCADRHNGQHGCEGGPLQGPDRTKGRKGNLQRRGA